MAIGMRAGHKHHGAGWHGRCQAIDVTMKVPLTLLLVKVIIFILFFCVYVHRRCGTSSSSASASSLFYFSPELMDLCSVSSHGVLTKSGLGEKMALMRRLCESACVCGLGMGDGEGVRHTHFFSANACNTALRQ